MSYESWKCYRGIYLPPLSLDRLFFVWPFASAHHQYHESSGSLCCSQNVHISPRGVNNCKSHLPVVLKICQLTVCWMSASTLLRQIQKNYSAAFEKGNGGSSPIILTSVCIRKFNVSAINMLRFSFLFIVKELYLQKCHFNTHVWIYSYDCIEQIGDLKCLCSHVALNNARYAFQDFRKLLENALSL